MECKVYVWVTIGGTIYCHMKCQVGVCVPHEMSSVYALRLEVLFTATWNVKCVCVKIGGIIYCHMKCQAGVWVKIGGTIYCHMKCQVGVWVKNGGTIYCHMKCQVCMR